jgi:hypothetical protein
VAADIDRDVNPYRTPTESNIVVLILNQIAPRNFYPAFTERGIAFALGRSEMLSSQKLDAALRL